MNRAVEKKPSQVLEAVEVPSFSSAGAAQGGRTFTPGAVSNYPNVALLKEAVRRQQGRLRRGTAKTKGRSEIAGTNRKPWRQKGTGRARAGTKKSPIWRGGGTVFGPVPRSYDYGLPKRQRQLAVRHAMLSKFMDGETRVVDSLPTERKTRGLAEFLSKIGVEGSCLIGIGNDMDRDQVRSLVLACRNLGRTEVLPVKDFNTLSLLRARNLILTTEAFDALQEGEANK